MNQTLLGDAFQFEAPRLTRPVGPDITAPFAALFHAVDALRPPGEALTVLFAGPDGTGTAACASGFARTAERALGLPVLFVDATGRDRADAQDRDENENDLLAAFRRGLSPREVALPTADRGILWTGFGRTVALNGAETARLIGAARDSFAVVVIDGGSLSGSSLAPALARHCDGTLLVARGGRTEAASLMIGRVAIERAGGQVLGAVLDGDETTMPRFLADRL